MTKRQEIRSIAGDWLIAGLLVVALLMLSGCNTMSGFGRDVESAGDTISDTAEDVQD